jgi:hypothetical protein
LKALGFDQELVHQLIFIGESSLEDSHYYYQELQFETASGKMTQDLKLAVMKFIKIAL